MGQRFKTKLSAEESQMVERDTLKELFNILGNHGNINLNDSEIQSYTCQNGEDQKH